jgi:NAD+ synthase (glutamine-hydrolysing)
LALEAIREGVSRGASITVLPELAITGYPPEDLLLREQFIVAARHHLDEIAANVTEGVAVVGFPELDGDLFNAAAVLADGRVQAIYRKRFLPNYGVFDEMRYFRAGSGPLVVEALGVRLGLTICEDLWYPTPICGELQAAGADLVVAPAASPFHRGMGGWRDKMLATRARDLECPLVFCNLVGGQDELVFDGRSLAVDAFGEVVGRGAEFAPEIVVCDLDVVEGRVRRLAEPRGRRLETPSGLRSSAIVARPVPNGGPPAPPAPGVPLDDEAAVWEAIVCGLRDYTGKNGIDSVVLGVSGGIDSALTAALAVDALGPESVTGIAMPSDFSSPASLADAQALAESLAFRLIVLPIANAVEAFEDTLAEQFAGTSRGVAEENLQARARGTLLMAYSNKFGSIVLATGNKSEAAVGYATLYGDMVGGISPIKDLPKTSVYRLARWRNASEGREVIPVNSIERPPSAELRPDQLDTDSLPPYEELDAVLEAYVERGFGPDEIRRETGVDAATVREIVRMVDRAEYKRRQGPFGIKLTPRAFGRDRRMPITNRDSP